MARALTPEDLAAVRQQVRARVLRWFAGAGHLDPVDARDMAGWHHGEVVRTPQLFAAYNDPQPGLFQFFIVGVC